MATFLFSFLHYFHDLLPCKYKNLPPEWPFLKEKKKKITRSFMSNKLIPYLLELIGIHKSFYPVSFEFPLLSKPERMRIKTIHCIVFWIPLFQLVVKCNIFLEMLSLVTGSSITCRPCNASVS